MPNDKKDRRPNDATSPGLSRRNFIAFAAGLTAAATGTASDREQRVIDMDTDVKTPDGICDAVFIHPARGSHPGVLLWHDSPGLRPVIRDLGKRIAAEGYSVLVPNLFYRAHRAPVFDASFDYANNPADRKSEEHTSELQSRLHLVCRLLLEKKKKNTTTHSTNKIIECLTQ